MARKKWTFRDSGKDENLISDLSRKLGVSNLMAKLLCNRGLCDYESAYNFLTLGDNVLHDPFLLADMDAAVRRVEFAVQNDQHIVIFGDYDADGVTATALLYRYLKSRGVTALDYYIPDRSDEGYGMNSDSIEKIAKSGADLIVTVDTGVSAVEEISLAKSLGVDVVVTDHHECPEVLPDAVAVVNPTRGGQGYPFANLAGVGVAFKLACAMEFSRLGESVDILRALCEKYSALVAFGTVADVMPLVDENRLFVKYGLHMMEKSPDLWTKALIDAVNPRQSGSRSSDNHVTATTIAFTMAPRINAAGRVGHAYTALELMLSDDPMQAKLLAEKLCESNNLRREIESQILAVAEEQLAAKEKIPYVAVVSGDGWNAGVIGIVASRITDKYSIPSLVISFDGDVGKGSGRSVKGVNLHDALAGCSDLLLKYGGHELAAGFSIERNNLQAFCDRINSYVGEYVVSNDTAPVLDLECEIASSDITIDHAREIELLEPCGAGNPKPVFCLRDCRVAEIVPLSDGKHLKLSLDSGGSLVTALMFGFSVDSTDICLHDRIDIAFELSLNQNPYNKVTSVQCIVRDFRHSDGFDPETYYKVFTDLKDGLKCQTEDNWLPDRDEFARLYLYIKRKLGSSNTVRLSLRELIDKQDRSSPVRCNVALAVLEHSGLIKRVSGDMKNGVAVFELCRVSAKVDLEADSLFVRIKNNIL